MWIRISDSEHKHNFVNTVTASWQMKFVVIKQADWLKVISEHLWYDTFLQSCVPLGSSVSEIIVLVLQNTSFKSHWQFQQELKFKNKSTYSSPLCTTKAEVVCCYRAYQIHWIWRWFFEMVLNNCISFWIYTSTKCCLHRSVTISIVCTAFLNHRCGIMSIQ